jgi:hypothetical protein
MRGVSIVRHIYVSMLFNEQEQIYLWHYCMSLQKNCSNLLPCFPVTTTKRASLRFHPDGTTPTEVIREQAAETIWTKEGLGGRKYTI